MKIKSKDVFMLKYAHGMTTEEIAKIFDINTDAVRKRLQRAREKIIEIYEKGEME